jgi:hypothetical protein
MILFTGTHERTAKETYIKLKKAAQKMVLSINQEKTIVYSQT